jgi:hypothetical protein
MKRILTLILGLMLVTGCNTSGIKHQHLEPVQPAAYADLQGNKNVTIREHVPVLTSSGEVVNIPLVSTNPPKSVIRRITEDSKKETLFVVTVESPKIAPPKETPKTEAGINKLPEPQPKKLTWWQKNGKRLITFYGSSGIVGLGVWYGWAKFFSKRKKKKATELVQTGDFKK